jgi:putative PIN family toxin of toxin-antitoxin system
LVEISRIVLDSNVLVSAFTSGEGASRQVLRRVLSSEVEALISLPLFAEYEAVLARPETQRRCPLTVAEQAQLFDAFLSRTSLVEVYYRWRPNLRDEGDNHVLELAVAAGDAPILTFNRRDFRSGELRFPGIVVQTPGAWLKSRGPSGG